MTRLPIGLRSESGRLGRQHRNVWDTAQPITRLEEGTTPTDPWVPTTCQPRGHALSNTHSPVSFHGEATEAEQFPDGRGTGTQQSQELGRSKSEVLTSGHTKPAAGVERCGTHSRRIYEAQSVPASLLEGDYFQGSPRGRRPRGGELAGRPPSKHSKCLCAPEPNPENIKMSHVFRNENIIFFGFLTFYYESDYTPSNVERIM